nr:MAG TPA: hypothetical protein [Caudoviricetes sp.]
MSTAGRRPDPAAADRGPPADRGCVYTFSCAPLWKFHRKV